MNIVSSVARAMGVVLAASLMFSIALVDNGSHGRSVSVVETPATVSPVAFETQNIRFATYNVCAQNCPKMAPFKSRAVGIAKQVKALKSDVVTMQETGTSGSHMKILRKAMAPEYKSTVGAKSRYIFYRVSTMTTNTTAGKTAGNATFVVQANSRSKKTYIAYQILRRIHTRVSVLVVNDHLTSLDSIGSDMARQAEIKQVILHTKAVRSRHKSSAVVFAGDFNSYRQSHEAGVDSDTNRYRVYNYMKSIGFEDSVVKAASTRNAGLNTLNPEPTDHRNFGVGRQLDHFFVQTNTDVLLYGILNRKVSYKNQFSDHDLSYMTIAIRK